MTQEQEWKKWLRQEFTILSDSISLANTVFSTVNVEIEPVRHYGSSLITHSIECARAIKLCMDKDLPGPAFALPRVQYEALLRGHIIIQEMDIEELDAFQQRLRRWLPKQSQHSPPTIKIRGSKWQCGGAGSWRPLQSDIANLFVRSVGNLALFHDLTHSGITQASQMLDEDGYIKPSYSIQSKILLLCLADRTVMFAMMMWPGSEQKYSLEIEQRVEKISNLRSVWEPHIGTPAT